MYKATIPQSIQEEIGKVEKEVQDELVEEKLVEELLVVEE